MTTTTELKLDGLVASARLTGRIDLLMEMRDWLDEKISASEKANDQLRENLVDEESRCPECGNTPETGACFRCKMD